MTQLHLSQGSRDRSKRDEATQRSQNQNPPNPRPSHSRSIPSYVEDHSAMPGGSQARLTPADLEFLRMHPELEMGIRGFTVERKIRAIEGWCRVVDTKKGTGDSQPCGYWKTAVEGSGSICRAGCVGGTWGPHGIHICDFGDHSS